MRIQLAFSTLAAALLLTGCSLTHSNKSHKQRLGGPADLALQGKIDRDANSDSVIPFDVVVVSDKTLLKQISQMDAATWFGAKGRCNYRGGTKAKVQFHSWEFVPGQTFLIDIPIPRGTKAVLGFADYSTAGDHRISLLTKGSQLVEMDKDGAHAVNEHSVRDPALTPAQEKRKVCPDD